MRAPLLIAWHVYIYAGQTTLFSLWGRAPSFSDAPDPFDWTSSAAAQLYLDIGSAMGENPQKYRDQYEVIFFFAAGDDHVVGNVKISSGRIVQQCTNRIETPLATVNRGIGGRRRMQCNFMRGLVWGNHR